MTEGLLMENTIIHIQILTNLLLRLLFLMIKSLNYIPSYYLKLLKNDVKNFNYPVYDLLYAINLLLSLLRAIVTQLRVLQK